MKKFISRFNQYSWILTIMFGVITSAIYTVFSKEWWFAIILFVYGIVLGIAQEYERNNS